MNLFNKYPHPDNFSFADRFRGGVLSVGNEFFELHTTDAGDDVHYIRVVNQGLWPGAAADRTARALDRSGPGGASRSQIQLLPSAGMRLQGSDQETLLASGPGGWFGVSGKKWMFRFVVHPAMQFYGLGEKHTPFERSGRAYWFWNTDAWADHPLELVRSGDYDPDYLSVPYLIVKQGNTYLGLLVDSPYPAMISAGAWLSSLEGLEPPPETGREILLAAAGGPPSLVMIVGPSLAELTRKFQQVVGVTPLPPLWSLGYHQSRWGYRGESDLTGLADRFERHRFPADGLFLDIDCMDGYRVFTLAKRHLPHPAATVDALEKRGFRVVPILDPGVKREEGYAVYDSGRAANVFCRNPAGTVFTGIVWPGPAAFPDFRLAGTRRWWAGHARRFFDIGFDGAWLDMNDPSTGAADCRDMLFDHGRAPHEKGRNTYALLMARATRAGMLAAHPDRRPFLLSRSGSTGSQRFCAHWTGDNFSTYRHLRRSIGKSLNLALSGVPFNGADVGGFGGDCSEALLVDWFKAAFLMPFFRNHTMHGSRAQEPWAYSPAALGIIRHYVRLRYTLLPYLYNLFIDQEETGEAIMRPLFYDFADRPSLPLGAIDDQFMVGPAILQAPFVREKGRQRDVVLPHANWLRADTGRWVKGGRRLLVRRQPDTTPLFVRDGSLVPFQPGERINNRKDLNAIGLLCGLSPGFRGTARLRYRTDDGLSYAYRRGTRTTLEITARIAGRRLELTGDTRTEGFGPVDIVPYTVNRFASVHLHIDGKQEIRHPVTERVQLAGKPFTWYRWPAGL